MTGALVACLAGWGVFLLYTAFAMGWRGLGPRQNESRDSRVRFRPNEWLIQAGMTDVRVSEFVAVVLAVVIVVGTLAYALFGAIAPAAFIGLCSAVAPVAAYRARRDRLRAAARAAWPQLIEEIRLLTGSLGRSLPVAVLEAGAKAPTKPMRDTFAAAQREWLLSTDFGRMTSVLKAGLADPTADATCETLLIAYEIGGSDLEHRLAALIDDRNADLQERSDAQSRQAGVRFARWFVLAVPVGMALCGMSIGNGRAAYRSTGGQLAVLAAVALTAACWAWASRIMRLPEPGRVFVD